jgi:hypothetical protein
VLSQQLVTAPTGKNGLGLNGRVLGFRDHRSSGTKGEEAHWHFVHLALGGSDGLALISVTGERVFAFLRIGERISRPGDRRRLVLVYQRAG